MYDAFVDALTKLGVSDPAKRLVVSGIPIRTQSAKEKAAA
jgi:hypothetical protein